jgi:hypothetical protein
MGLMSSSLYSDQQLAMARRAEQVELLAEQKGLPWVGLVHEETPTSLIQLQARPRDS